MLEDISVIQNAHSKIKCQCMKCGTISNKTIYTYLNGYGCSTCYGNKTKTSEEFIKELPDGYELLSEYKNNRTKVKLKHECGFCYETTPGNLLALKNEDKYSTRGLCPKCTRKRSRGEKVIRDFLEDNNIEYIEQYPLTIEQHSLRFDFYLPKHDIYIEFLGIQHFEQKAFNRTEKQFHNQVDNDNRKRRYCKDKLIEITYNEFDKIHDILAEKIL